MMSSFSLTRWLAAGSVLMLGLALGALDASAGVALKMDLAGLTSSADSIVVGKVEKQTSRWEGSRIVTEVQVRVAVPVLGGAGEGEVVRIRCLGGRVGDLAQRVSGAAVFEDGEEVLVFLRDSKKYRMPAIVGLSQGHYRVQDLNGTLQVSQQLEHLQLATPIDKDAQGKTMARVSEDQGPHQAPLHEVLSEVRETMKKLEMTPHPSFSEMIQKKALKDVDFAKKLRSVRALPAPSLQPPTRKTP